jgi:hypothetical protein
MAGRFKFLGDKALKKELTELQDAFASRQFRDELERMRRRSKVNKTSITRDRGQPIMVKTLLSIKVRIDGDKTHQRPHVHVDYGENHHAASFAIDNGERLAGKLNQKYDKPAREWIGRNKRNLLKAWHAITSGQKTDKIVAQLRRTA